MMTWIDKAQVPRDASPEVVRGALASLYRRTEGSVIHCNEPRSPRSPSQKGQAPFETRDDQ